MMQRQLMASNKSSQCTLAFQLLNAIFNLIQRAVNKKPDNHFFMMKSNFLSLLHALTQSGNKFDTASVQIKATLLKKLSGMALPGGEQLLQYHDLLLFLCAYPGNPQLLQFAEKELKRITLHAKKNKHSEAVLTENEGMPYGNIVTRFSPDFLQWLCNHKDLKVEFDSFYNPALSLNDILKITLPFTLKAETTAGLTNEELLTLLNIQPDKYAPFILGQLEQLKAFPILQELMIEWMNLYVKLVPKNERFSKANNRIPVKEMYYHQDLLKKFDHEQLLNKPLPPVHIPQQPEQDMLYKVIRNSMALTVREIDPATFMQPSSMRLYKLERGLTLAVYSMVPDHQLPLETYFGVTFFKNGIPISYGALWVFGQMGKIGLNIFEPYRGGESGYILCQLIRMARLSMGVTYMEIEPFQYGLNNPGGISSGAFWFYYKYGFRPVSRELKLLAENEYRKIKTRKDYRSSEKTLLRFTEDNIGLNLAKKLPLNVMTISTRILSAIKKDWQHNYAPGKEKAITAFCKKVQLDSTLLDDAAKNVLEDMAFWAVAMKVNNARQLQLMKQMVVTKTKDDYAYQQLLLDFFNTK
jgi:hypothetical protein